MSQDRTTETGQARGALAAAYLELGADGRISYVDASAEALLGQPAAALVGQGIAEAFDEGMDGTLARACRRALAERVSVEVVEYHAPLGGWLEARIHPSDAGLAVSLRDVSERREAELASGALQQVLELIPSFHRGGSPEEVAQAVCRAAIGAFGPDAATVWALDDDGYRIVWREPVRDDMPPGLAYGSGRWPLRAEFVPDLLQSQSEAARRYATAAGVRSVLRVPILEGTLGADSLLALSWQTPVAEPPPALLAVVQRFADQAGLAIEQARRRELQVEAEALGQTLGRLLELTPRFHTAGTARDVARAVCDAACELFECQRVSLWTLQEDRLSLLGRAPGPLEALPAALSLREVPELAEHARAGRPFFVGDALATYESPQARRYYEEAGVRSVLRLPIAGGGRDVDALLALCWAEPREQPPIGQVALAQRFADQAALAIEQARRREAQAAAEELSAALDRVLEVTNELRRARSASDVQQALCAAACATFGGDEATLWTGDELDASPALAARLVSGQPGFLADLAIEDPALYASLGAGSGWRAQLQLPLVTAGSRAVLAVSWRSPAPAPSASTLTVARRFADQAALALAEAGRRDAEREAALLHARLEDNLIPNLHNRDPDFRIVPRSLPGESRMAFGGDFYDALRLADGTVELVIGDVLGHGPDAAALGASLRAGWRALVLAGVDRPVRMQGLNALLLRESDGRDLFATVCLCQIRSDRRELRVALAGHPPPLLVTDRAQVLAPQTSPPLGVLPQAGWHELSVPLPERFALLLYTDGLIEGRAAPGSTARFGLDRLVERLVGPAERVDDGAIDRLLAEVLAANGGDLADDLALLLVATRDSPPPGTTVELVLPATPASVPLARHAVARLAEAHGASAARSDDLRLAVSEACANVVLHAYRGEPGTIELRARVEGWLTVEVRDHGVGFATPSDAPGLGLGLPLMRSLARAAEIVAAPTGGTIVRLSFGLR